MDVSSVRMTKDSFLQRAHFSCVISDLVGVLDLLVSNVHRLGLGVARNVSSP